MSEPLYELTLTVNGEERIVSVPARRLLSDLLRHDLRLTGTHVGCEHGVCGACTVLLDGEPARSCLTFAVSVDGHEITTVEGLAAADGTLHPVQQAFRDNHGLQCGFCTSGFVMSACGFLADHRGDADPPDDDEIREGMSGNLCRCTGYAGILEAVKQADGVFRETGADPCAQHGSDHLGTTAAQIATSAARAGQSASPPDEEVAP